MGAAHNSGGLASMLKHIGVFVIVGIIMILVLRAIAGDNTIGRWYCTLGGVIGLLVGIAVFVRQYRWGLTCNRCHEVALPVSGTGNRYRCPGCGRQFAGARHGM